MRASPLEIGLQQGVESKMGLVTPANGNPGRLVDGIYTIGMLLTSAMVDIKAGYPGIPTEDEGRDPDYFSLACLGTRQRCGWPLGCSTASDPYIFVFVVDRGEKSVRELPSIVLLRAIPSLRTAPYLNGAFAFSHIILCDVCLSTIEVLMHALVGMSWDSKNLGEGV
eukprot:Gb_37851 [translate_table: standard]